MNDTHTDCQGPRKTSRDTWTPRETRIDFKGPGETRETDGDTNGDLGRDLDTPVETLETVETSGDYWRL